MEIQAIGATGAAAPGAPVQREPLPALLPSPSVAGDAKAAAPKEKDVKEAVKDIQDFVSTVTTDLRFTVDKETGRTVVTVVDSETQQVVRQIPTEDIMKIARNIDRMQGLLFSGRA